MKSTETDLSPSQRVFRALAQAPFSTLAELSDLDDLKQYSRWKAMSDALAAGLIDRIRHGGLYGNPRVRTYRWFLTGDGVDALAGALRRSRSFLLEEYPVSSAWQSSILRRVDTAQVVYRLRELAARATGERCLWRWQRSDWRDGTLESGENRYIHVRRFGHAITRKAVASRLGEMMEDWKRARVGAALLVVTSYTMMRFIERWLRDNAGGVYVWTVRESDLFSNDALGDIWHVSTSTGVRRHTMKRMLEPIRKRADKRTLDFVRSASYGRASRPLVKGRLVKTQPLMANFAALTPPVRRAFDLVADWPLISQSDALGISGTNQRNWLHLMRQITDLNLLQSFEFRDPARAKRSRYALTDDGYKVISMRDRVLERQLRSLWSVKEGGDGSVSWHVTLNGTIVRQLAKELSHTDGVYRVVSLLAQGCREGDGVELVEVLPAHRSERWFKMKRSGQIRGVKPDASGAIRTERGLMPFMLEYEQRAITPSAMKSVVSKYAAYFDNPISIEDWGDYPAVLIVFGDTAAASRFTQYTAKNMELPWLFGGTKLPIYVSSIPSMESAGALGNIWFQPHDLDQGLISLSEFGDIGSGSASCV